MSRSRPHPFLVRTGVALLVVTLVVTLVGLADAATASPRSERATHAAAALPGHLPLPDGFQPEGIAIGRGPVAYLGSRADGDIYRLDLRTGSGTVISQGPGTPSLGMKLDRRGRLFVSGGSGGDARVVDVRTGSVLASYQLTTGTSFVNDVILTQGAAYFTDSMQAQLYRVPFGRGGALPAHAETIPLTGQWQQVAGLNANGITPTPDRQGLLVVNSTSGLLYRVDPGTGRARVVDLGGASLVNGDGMRLEGRTLYVVQNQDNRIAVIHLGRAGRTGEVTGHLTSSDFDVPTTIARFGRALYLPNARFTTPPTADTEYWVTRLPRHR